MKTKEKSYLILADIFQQECIKEEISEQIRLLYVALTRAREKMIIVSPYFNNDSKLDESLKLKYRSLWEFRKN